eukprot:1196164-Prorocentrum_minimum.AAC.1
MFGRNDVTAGPSSGRTFGHDLGGPAPAVLLLEEEHEEHHRARRQQPRDDRKVVGFRHGCHGGRVRQLRRVHPGRQDEAAGGHAGGRVGHRKDGGGDVGNLRR